MDLGDRMKCHEAASRHLLTRRVPVILRVDGRSFHTFTKKAGFDKPFCNTMAACMNAVAHALMNEIQGAQIAYVQSDEVSVLITDYANPETQPWFGYVTQKMASISASIASSVFTGRLHFANKYYYAQFDARVFNIAREEVVNYFIWRQQDAVRNSVQMMARSIFSHRQCERRSCRDLQVMLAESGHNWTDLERWKKHGRCVIRDDRELRTVDVPIFVDDRSFITQFV